MIQTELHGFAAYRVHAPQWAVLPLGGKGATIHGGRANRSGVRALYLAFELETAARECQQLSRLMPPGTLVSYEVTAAPVVDFSSGFSGGHWAPLWESFAGDWRAHWFEQRIEPPGWVLGDEVIVQGAKGNLFELSIVAGGVNRVLYTAELDDNDQVAVFNSNDALPKDQGCWR